MTDILWFFVFAQMMMGAFDTLYHHEGTERLAWRPSQRLELTLHGIRNLAYAVMFMALGWFEPRGGWAIALVLLLLGELFITLWDFVEEDRTRLLPASERVTHTLLTLNYGVILAMLIPWLIGLAQQPSALASSYHGLMSWFCILASIGVVISGLRDLAAAKRTERLTEREPSELAAILPARQSVLVTGGTGFIGSRLVQGLLAARHEVTVLTRNKSSVMPLAAHGPLRNIQSLEEIADNAHFDAVVNLAGEPISDTPWTKAKRVKIVQSRLRTTYDIIRLIKRLEHKPEVLINGSAIGWYGLRGDEILDEQAQGANCFSRRVCRSWERAAAPAESLGVRTVYLRTGLVLDRSGGMLAKLLTPFEFGLGGKFGHGKQWMSWIHRDDLVRLICHAIARREISGPLNGTAPEPVTNAEFTAALGKALKRPAILPVPAWPLRKGLGAFAEELLLSGQLVIPEVARRSGFIFEYPSIDLAFAQIVGSPPNSTAQDRAQAVLTAERRALAPQPALHGVSRRR
ncbi:TIGR01777 family oxidoreductase [uncultured Erythrobacter sp.]|uniref:TIGR01777 family oxidoreductase n=1 Tax=uncultured Erythrobacter sp. TaxID=263913 RepID=UPI002622A173|nr:TIGR01777 family oxidoreductase [uncultured Erythrobacter sp.]